MEIGEYTSWVSCQIWRNSFETSDAVSWVDNGESTKFVSNPLHLRQLLYNGSDNRMLKTTTEDGRLVVNNGQVLLLQFAWFSGSCLGFKSMWYKSFTLLLQYSLAKDI